MGRETLQVCVCVCVRVSYARACQALVPPESACFDFHLSSQGYKRKTEAAKKEYLKALAAYRASLVSKVTLMTQAHRHRLMMDWMEKPR